MKSRPTLLISLILAASTTSLASPGVAPSHSTVVHLGRPFSKHIVRMAKKYNVHLVQQSDKAPLPVGTKIKFQAYAMDKIISAIQEARVELKDRVCDAVVSSVNGTQYGVDLFERGSEEYVGTITVDRASIDVGDAIAELAARGVDFKTVPADWKEKILERMTAQDGRKFEEAMKNLETLAQEVKGDEGRIYRSFRVDGRLYYYTKNTITDKKAVFDADRKIVAALKPIIELATAYDLWNDFGFAVWFRPLDVAIYSWGSPLRSLHPEVQSGPFARLNYIGRPHKASDLRSKDIPGYGTFYSSLITDTLAGSGRGD